MAPSPVPVLLIIGIYLVIFGAMEGTTNTMGLDESPCSPDAAAGECFEEPDGLLDSLLGIVATIWDVVVLIGRGLVFNVDGAPIYIQVPVAIGIIGSLGWSIASLIRGN